MIVVRILASDVARIKCSYYLHRGDRYQPSHDQLNNGPNLRFGSWIISIFAHSLRWAQEFDKAGVPIGPNELCAKLDGKYEPRAAVTTFLSSNILSLPRLKLAIINLPERKGH